MLCQFIKGFHFLVIDTVFGRRDGIILQIDKLSYNSQNIAYGQCPMLIKDVQVLYKFSR